MTIKTKLKRLENIGSTIILISPIVMFIDVLNFRCKIICGLSIFAIGCILHLYAFYAQTKIIIKD